MPYIEEDSGLPTGCSPALLDKPRGLRTGIHSMQHLCTNVPAWAELRNSSAVHNLHLPCRTGSAYSIFSMVYA